MSSHAFSCIHTYTVYTHTFTYSHARVRAHTHTQSLTDLLTNSLSGSYIHTLTHI